MRSQASDGAISGLFVAFDIGTATSGVSYNLNPEEPLELCSVNQFPGQEHIPDCTRVPSVLLYNPFGQLCAAGAEVEHAEDRIGDDYDEWSKIQLFKLHLDPSPKDMWKPDLPQTITSTKAYADMLMYLMKCAKEHILRSNPALTNDWNLIADNAEFIISHPNSWGGLQQWKLRQAAVKAGLVPDDPDGHTRVSFVTEGEAILHYCVRSEPSILCEKAIIVADLGAGTLNINAFKVLSSDHAQLEEAAIPFCSSEGSTAVCSRVRAFLERRLRNSSYGTSTKIQHMVEVFDKTTNPMFRSSGDVCSIRFGMPSENDYACGIRSGEVRLSGVEVASFFEPTINNCVDTIRSFVKSVNERINNIYFVGGFCSSPYLISTLRERLQDLGLTFCFPNTQTANAVAEGAISFLLEPCVSSRMSPITFGTHCELVFNPRNPEHIKRSRQHDVKRSGSTYVRGAFVPIVKRGCTVCEGTEYRQNFHREFDSVSEISDLTWFVIKYEGENEPPKWLDDVTTPGIFRDFFKVTADLSDIRNSIRSTRNADGSRYYRVDLSVVMTYVGPELRAKVMWKGPGSTEERRIPALISAPPDDAINLYPQLVRVSTGALYTMDKTAMLYPQT